MRRPIIKPKTPIFLGCEGESEQAYGQLLNDLLQAEGRPVHLEVVNLSPGAGDPIARLRRAAQEIARIIREVTVRRGQVRIEYEFIPVDPFLVADDFDALSFELDIGNWEMNRTHWAVKDVNLPKELHTARGIVLPSWTRQAGRAVDITRHNFEVGLSFPGEARGLVEQVARELEARIGPHAYFYDNNYVSQLARPSLDTLLQDIYRNRSKLIVVFLGEDYQRKDWCGVEFRAIREIIMAREDQRVMFVRVDEGAVDGVFRTDGYVDARRFNPAEIAQFIAERAALIP